MDIFQENQLKNLSEIPIIPADRKYLEKLTHELNQNRMVILSWHHKVWKSALIKEFLLKTKLENKVFLFDKEYLINKNTNWKELINTFNESIKYNNTIKIVILNNFNKILDIKYFIQYIHSHQNNFKIILIWNSVQIPWVNEIEYLPIKQNYNSIKNNLSEIIQYWSLPNIYFWEWDYIIKNQLNLIVSEMYLNEILINFWVKNIELYQFTMTYLSKIESCLSLRELQKWISEIQQITLKTLIDYINFSIRAKIIKPIYRYDFKKQKIISSRVKYYFTDTGIKNSISKYSLSERELKENYLYQSLAYHDYKIQSGLNGAFDFTFHCSKDNENICIHYSNVTEKVELKKEINKLNKVPVDWKKYLVLDSIEKLWIKKLIYDNVEIVEYQDIFQKLQTK